MRHLATAAILVACLSGRALAQPSLTPPTTPPPAAQPSEPEEPAYRKWVSVGIEGQLGLVTPAGPTSLEGEVRLLRIFAATAEIGPYGRSAGARIYLPLSRWAPYVGAGAFQIAETSRGEYQSHLAPYHYAEAGVTRDYPSGFRLRLFGGVGWPTNEDEKDCGEDCKVPLMGVGLGYRF